MLFWALTVVIYLVVNGTATSLLVLIQNILNGVPKTNYAYTDFERQGGKYNDTNWQKDDISVLAAVSDTLCSTLVRGVHSILISSPLESILGLCLSSSQLVFSPVVLEFQLAFLGLMNQICDLVLASLLSCWLISFFLEMRWKSQTFSFIYLL